MKLHLAALAAILSAGAAAQPVALRKGDPVAIVVGPGTDMKPGTKLRGTVTRSNDEGLGFRVAKHGTYWVKWSHIRSVNGARLESDRAFAAAAEAIGVEPAVEAASAPPEPPVASPAPDRAASSPAELVRPSSSGGARGYPRERSRFDDAPSRGYKLAASLDYFGVGNAATRGQLSDLTRRVCGDVMDQGATSCAASASVDGAIGFRAGFWRPAEGFEWGASLGYLHGGPSGSGKLTVNTVPAGSGTASQSDNTLRLLGEVRKSIPLNDRWSLRMGAGLGMAEDFWNASCSSSGSGANCASLGLPSRANGSQGWITWELSPSIAYGRWDAGFRYAGFGRTGAVPWNTFGGFLGAEF